MAEMPGPPASNHGPGRRAPVRGDTPLLDDRSRLRDDDDDRSSIAEETFTRDGGGIENLEQSLSAARLNSRPRDATKTNFPPSPPSTIAEDDDDDDILYDSTHGQHQDTDSIPPSSPASGLQPLSARLRNAHLRWDGSDGSSQASSTPASISSFSGRQLNAAATSALYPEPQRRSVGRQHPQASKVNISRIGRLPDTPISSMGISPICPSSTFAQHPSESAKRFLKSIFADFPTQVGSEHVVGVADDAGVDLVCPGWEGAVLDQTRLNSNGHGGSVGSRTLYAAMPCHSQAPEKMRADVLNLLDLASEQLSCELVIIAVRKGEMDEADCKATLHGLCYVGGSVMAAGLGIEGVTLAGKHKDPVSGCTVAEGMVLVAIEL